MAKSQWSRFISAGGAVMLVASLVLGLMPNSASAATAYTAQASGKGASISLAGTELLSDTLARRTADTEKRLRTRNPHVRLATGLISRMTGVRTVRVRPEGWQASDLAVNAAAKVLASCGLQAPEVDLLVFASASQDMVEPATAHITAAKLGLGCPVMDVKNACNSFLNGLEVADSLIASGRYGRVLVVTGESPSRAVRWSVPDFATFASSFPGYTMSDGGAAVLADHGAAGLREEHAEAHGDEHGCGAGTLMCFDLAACIERDVQVGFHVGNHSVDKMFGHPICGWS